MKTSSLALFFGIFVFHNLLGGDLVTSDGKMYKNYSIERLNLKGLEISHATGCKTIPYNELPNDLRKKYAKYEKLAKIRIEQLKVLKAKKLIEQKKIAQARKLAKEKWLAQQKLKAEKKLAQKKQFEKENGPCPKSPIDSALGVYLGQNIEREIRSFGKTYGGKSPSGLIRAGGNGRYEFETSSVFKSSGKVMCCHYVLTTTKNRIYSIYCEIEYGYNNSFGNTKKDIDKIISLIETTYGKLKFKPNNTNNRIGLGGKIATFVDPQRAQRKLTVVQNNKSLYIEFLAEDIKEQDSPKAKIISGGI